jgi:hypothetical protein
MHKNPHPPAAKNKDISPDSGADTDATVVIKKHDIFYKKM